MKKYLVIITLIITFSILTPPGEVFALAAPVERVEWSNNFQSKGIIDEARSTIEWEKGLISLKKEGDEYVSAGVLWTKDIRFRQDIHSLVLNGIYNQPGGTRVLGFVSFEGDIKEYPLTWGAVYTPENQVRKLRLKIFLATDNPNFSPGLSEIYLAAELMDRSERGLVQRDSKRVADLKSVGDIVKKYYTDFGAYPIVNIEETNKEDQWRLLKNILESASLNYNKNYNRRFISQPTGVDQDYRYGYLTGENGVYFLLWTRLEEQDSKHLQNSWRGELFGIDCSGQTYCFSPKVLPGEPEPILRYFENGKEKDKLDRFQTATFVKEENDPRVWLKLDDYRVWMRTPTIFEKAGGIWKNIVSIFNVAKIPLLKLVKEADDPSVYFIASTGFKRHLPDARALEFYGQSSEIITLDDKVIDILPDNELIRARGGTKVYYLDQKIKRWITSPVVLERMGFSFSQVVEIDPRELDYYPEGNPIFSYPQ